MRDPRIAAALRAVPRHLFVPDAPLTRAYRDEVIPIKFEDSEAVSTLSQPSAVATMLEQLQLEPGQRVLEIGAGTGYNAALLAHLTGDGRLVTTVDLDADLAARAREALTAAGWADVTVLAVDGFLGVPERTPFDRIELSVATRVISPHWVEQLVDGGVLVCPLHVKGLPFLTPGFRKRGLFLVSESIRACSFVLLRGESAAGGARFRLPVRPELHFVWESEDEFPAGLLTRIFKQAGRPRGDVSVSWAAATHLLLTHEDAFYAETSDRSMRGIVLVDSPSQSLAVIVSATDGWGATAVMTYGGDAAYGRLADAIQAWVDAGRPGLESLRLTAVPNGAEVELAPGEYRLSKPHFDLIASYHDRNQHGN